MDTITSTLAIKATTPKEYNVYEYNEFFVLSITIPGWEAHFYNELFPSPDDAVKKVLANKPINPKYKGIIVSQIGDKVLTFTTYK